MALEALYQQKQAIDPDEIVTLSNGLGYRFRSIRFDKAQVLEEGNEAVIILSLTQPFGTKDWYEFRVCLPVDIISVEHCSGLIPLQHPINEPLTDARFAPLKHSTSG